MTAFKTKLAVFSVGLSALAIGLFSTRVPTLFQGFFIILFCFHHMPLEQFIQAEVSIYHFSQ